MIDLALPVHPLVMEAGRRLLAAETPTAEEVLRYAAELIEAKIPHVEALALVTVASQHPKVGMVNLVRAARKHREDGPIGGLLTFLRETLMPMTTNVSSEANLRAARLVLISELKGITLMATIKPDYAEREQAERGFSVNTFRGRMRREPTAEDLVLEMEVGSR